MILNVPSRYFFVRILLLGLSLCFFILSGCAVNPATKQREFMIVSDEQEFRIGQRVDKQVREEMGVYLELPELRSLVKEVGGNIGHQEALSMSTGVCWKG